MIRELLPEDEARLAAFFLQSDTPDITTHFHPFPLTSQTAERLARAPRGDRYFIALSSEEIIGMSMLRGWDEGFEIPSFGILVKSSHQGRGIGRDLVEHALAAARQAGAPAVRLTVDAENVRARAWYERLGFVADSTSGYDGGPIVMLLPLRKG